MNKMSRATIRRATVGICAAAALAFIYRILSPSAADEGGGDFPSRSVAQGRSVPDSDSHRPDEEVVVTERQAVAISPGPSVSVGETSEWERLMAGEALLPKVRWDFVRHAGTPKRALANSYLNPNKVQLSPVAEEQLKALIDKHRKEIERAEAAMHGSRFGWMSARREQGTLESMRVDFNSEQAPASTNPEEESGTFASGAKRYDYRIQWGENPEYDDFRIKVLHSKQSAVSAIRAFIGSH